MRNDKLEGPGKYLSVAVYPSRRRRKLPSVGPCPLPSSQVQFRPEAYQVTNGPLETKNLHLSCHIFHRLRLRKAIDTEKDRPRGVVARRQATVRGSTAQQVDRKGHVVGHDRVLASSADLGYMLHPKVELARGMDQVRCISGVDPIGTEVVFFVKEFQVVPRFVEKFE